MQYFKKKEIERKQRYRNKKKNLENEDMIRWKKTKC
jgi:hypothetical protein